MLELVVNVSLKVQGIAAILSCARQSSKISSKTQGLVPVALMCSVSKLRLIRLKDIVHSSPILSEMLETGYIAVLAILMDLMVKYSINHHKIDF